MQSTEIKHIEITPGTCGEKPRLAGTRIRVQDVVVWPKQGQSPDEIVTGYPHLTLGDVQTCMRRWPIITTIASRSTTISGGRTNWSTG